MVYQNMFSKELEGAEREITQCINLDNPYWRINLYPHVYTEDLFTLEQCESLIKNITTSSEYSYRDLTSDCKRSKKWLEGYSCLNLPEYWRFYLSGQFVSFSEIENKTLNPDDSELKDKPQIRKISQLNKEANFIYPIIKEFGLAKQLCQSEQYDSRLINISMELINVKDFILEVETFDDTSKTFSSKKGEENKFKNLWSIEPSDLIDGKINEKVLEAIIWFARCFSWGDCTFPENILKEHYRDLLEVTGLTHLKAY